MPAAVGVSSAVEPVGGTVVALGRESTPGAERFAHLTGRRVVTVANADDVPSPTDFNVLVSARPALPSSLLDRLTQPSLATVPGVILADGPDSLERRVLTAATAANGADGNSLLVELDFIHRSGGSDETDADLVRASIRNALGVGASVLTVLTHADGLNAYLGDDLTLCPRDSLWPNGADRSDAPACAVTGFCHRRSAPFDAALRSSELLHPSAIAARVLVMNACVAVIPEDNYIPAASGFGIRLMTNPRIGAMIAAWRPSLTWPLHTRELAEALLAGVPAGAAVARYNRARDADGSSHRLGLFGDPTTIAVTNPRPNIVAASPKPTSGSIDGSDRLAAMLRNPTANGFDEIADALAAEPHFTDLWLPTATGVRRLLHPTDCLMCSNSVVTYRVSTVGGAERDLELCPRCGVTRDAPASLSASLLVRDGIAVLDAPPRHGSWSATLSVHAHPPFVTSHCRWPATSDGSPQIALRLDPVPPVPIVVSLTMVSTFGALRLSRTIHGAGVSVAEGGG